MNLYQRFIAFLESLFSGLVGATSPRPVETPAPSSGTTGAGPSTVAPVPVRVDFQNNDMVSYALAHGAPLSIAQLIASKCASLGVPVHIVTKICRIESSFRSTARNDSDVPPSVGLMGIKSTTAISLMGWTNDRQLAERRLSDAATNLEVGIMLLKDINASRREARQDEKNLVGMFHLGEPRWYAVYRNPDANPIDRADLAAYLSRYERA